MKFSKIKNIQLKKVGQYISFGLDKDGNLIVIKLDSKYFPSSVTLEVIKTILHDNNMLNNDGEQAIMKKLVDILNLIKDSAGNGEHMFVVSKEKGIVQLIKN